LELNGLKADPEERTNLARKAEHAGRVKQMRAALLAELRRTKAPLANKLPGIAELPTK
jgi:hypothetical protein